MPRTRRSRRGSSPTRARRSSSRGTSAPGRSRCRCSTCGSEGAARRWPGASTTPSSTPSCAACGAAAAGSSRRRARSAPALAALRSGTSVAILLDENGGRSGPFPLFFGRPASTRKTPALLSALTGAPIVVGAAVRRGERFLFRLALLEPPAGSRRRRATSSTRPGRIVRIWEAWVREDPLQWRWIHWRWKTRPGGSEETYTRRDVARPSRTRPRRRGGFRVSAPFPDLARPRRRRLRRDPRDRPRRRPRPRRLRRAARPRLPGRRRVGRGDGRARARRSGPGPGPCAANLVHPEEARALVAAAGERVDVLVHAAALGSFKPLLDVKPAQWDLTLAVNARAFLLLARAASERMPDGGRLVALSSLGGSRFVPEYGAIGPSKAALEAVVRSLAVELGPRGILVNAVSAGLVPTASVRLHPAVRGARRPRPRRLAPRPPRDAGGGRRGRPLPPLAARRVGHGPDARRRRGREPRDLSGAGAAGHYNRGACPDRPASTSRERSTTCRGGRSSGAPSSATTRTGSASSWSSAGRRRSGAGSSTPTPSSGAPSRSSSRRRRRTSPPGCGPSAGATSRRSTGGTDGAARSSTGRFRSLLVDPESSFLEAARSVALAPVRARLARAALDWRWSSAPATAGLAERPGWLTVDATLRRLSPARPRARERFRRLVSDTRGIRPLRERAVSRLVVGSPEFARQVRLRLLAGPAPGERLAARGRRAARG